MSHEKSYKKTKKHFMKEISPQLAKRNIEMRYQNEKIYGQTKDAFIRYWLPQNQEDNKIHQNAKSQDVENQRESPVIHTKNMYVAAIK
ncbi:hypothetical protein T10_1627 [Trichinella papuae]|uniref:Uncharacterized protein n=1 Tax=Trichinella papuae TaxID=268474 RepID=A0A0V1M7Q0_9BILA|nr:hypothetical protein T10_1627 [Trichinella papuae]